MSKKRWRELLPPDPVSWDRLDRPAPTSWEDLHPLLRGLRTDKGFKLAEYSVELDTSAWEMSSPLMRMARTLTDALCAAFVGDPLDLFFEYQDVSREVERVYRYAFYLEGVKDGMQKAREENAP